MSKIANTKPGEMALIGCLGILNVGDGDTKLTFDPKNEAERARASKIVTDMLRRGFAIMVQVGERDGKPLFQRAESFDPETCEYLIFGMPDEQPSEASPAPVMRARRGRPRKELTRVPAAEVRGVAIARSAGG